VRALRRLSRPGGQPRARAVGRDRGAGPADAAGGRTDLAIHAGARARVDEQHRAGHPALLLRRAHRAHPARRAAQLDPARLCPGRAAPALRSKSLVGGCLSGRPCRTGVLRDRLHRARRRCPGRGR
jgi:hypothetical protein